MVPGQPQRFSIRFEWWYAILSSVLLMFPAYSYVEVDADEVRVRMGWGFRARFPKSAVTSTVENLNWTISRGVHGFGGRWLVNGSGRGILTINLVQPQRGYVAGIPVWLRQLMVSVVEPAALATALTSST